ncbi:hypothetical protein BKA70DRAFT_1103528 [Coprinopsis sp. MPI-PUGE-AT-0042]|nr:hypothetical protein BKA70DRAFT_1103528 [Coprinopsis sp. MPI-PUGE-AT-0042]
MSSTKEDDENGCPVLRGPENFDLWLVRIRGELQERKCSSVIKFAKKKGKASVEDVADPDASPFAYDNLPTRAERLAAQEREEKARGVLMRFISNRLAMDVGHLETAQEIYDKLVEIHQGSNVGLIGFHAYKKLSQMKWDGAYDTFDDHVSGLQFQHNKLSNLGLGFPQLFLAYTLLDSPPEGDPWDSYATTALTTVAAANGGSADKISFHDISNQLAAVNLRRKSSGDAIETALKADAKSKGGAPKKSGAGKAKRWCSYHNSTSHDDEHCWSQKEKKGDAKTKDKDKGGNSE